MNFAELTRSAFVIAKEVVKERNAYGVLTEVRHYPVKIENVHGAYGVRHITSNESGEEVGFVNFFEAQAVVNRYNDPAEVDGRVIWDYQAGDWLVEDEPFLDAEDSYYGSFDREDFHSDG